MNKTIGKTTGHGAKLVQGAMTTAYKETQDSRRPLVESGPRHWTPGPRQSDCKRLSSISLTRTPGDMHVGFKQFTGWNIWFSQFFETNLCFLHGPGEWLFSVRKRASIFLSHAPTGVTEMSTSPCVVRLTVSNLRLFLEQNQNEGCTKHAVT